jgi:hypothetical protein
VLLAHVDGTRAGYSGTRLAEFYLDLLQKVQPLPGVTAASFSLITPLSGGGIGVTLEVRASGSFAQVASALRKTLQLVGGLRNSRLGFGRDRPVRAARL